MPNIFGYLMRIICNNMPMTTCEAVAIRVKDLLEKNHISQYALCKKIAIDPSNIYNILYQRCKTVTLDKIYGKSERRGCN